MVLDGEIITFGDYIRRMIGILKDKYPNINQLLIESEFFVLKLVENYNNNVSVEQSVAETEKFLSSGIKR